MQPVFDLEAWEKAERNKSIQSDAVPLEELEEAWGQIKK